MKIAIFDFKIVATNPVGGCHLQTMRALADQHEFIVFARAFDNPRPDRIRFVKVPVPARPLVLEFIAYRLLAPLLSFAYQLRHRITFDLVQSVESNVRRPDVVYAHFCHRAYVRARLPSHSGFGLRALLRRIDHRVRAMTEPRTYRHCRHVVVPSHGLRRELEAEFPRLRGRVTVIGNPIDVPALRRPAEFDRDACRQSLGIAPNGVALVFAALGHFERKGLPVVFEAMARVTNPCLKLIVIGGQRDLVRSYRTRACRLGIAHQVVFVGMQDDPRRFLWAADAFILPSAYETFSKACYEAAAAGLPLIVAPVYGIEDIVTDGVNALVTARDAGALADSLSRFSCMSRTERERLGRCATRSVTGFTIDGFVRAWQAFYDLFDLHLAPLGALVPALLTSTALVEAAKEWGTLP